MHKHLRDWRKDPRVLDDPELLENEKSIYRVDQDAKNSHGWNVIIVWKKKPYPKWFSDAKYGDDPVKAKRAARRHRNELEKQLGKPRTDRIVVGDAKHIRRRLKAGVPVFEVSYAPEIGKVARTSVSIKKYGKQGAFAKAVEKAKEKLKESWGKVA